MALDGVRFRGAFLKVRCVFCSMVLILGLEMSASKRVLNPEN